MKRREFLAASSAVGMAAVAGSSAAAEGDDGDVRDVYELRQYHLDTKAQRDGLDAFLRDAMIPALNRLKISPVGESPSGDCSTIEPASSCARMLCASIRRTWPVWR